MFVKINTLHSWALLPSRFSTWCYSVYRVDMLLTFAISGRYCFLWIKTIPLTSNLLYYAKLWFLEWRAYPNWWFPAANSWPSFHFPSEVYTQVLQPNGLQQPTNRRPTSICHTSKIFSNFWMISENINNSSIIIL